MKKVLTKLLGDPKAKRLKQLQSRTDAINDLADSMAKLSDADLQKITDDLKDRLTKKETMDDLLSEAFAAVREASTRVLKMRHFDVQLIGGMALHEGNVAEMRTGEGKTLVATLPVYLNALEGHGVHVVTVNDYLAQRDAGWMAKLYDFMGLSTSVIIGDASFIYDTEFENKEHDDERFYHLRPCTRREAYEADITYGTNNEFGFDYLRDNMVREKSQLRQRPLNYAIVDEVDSILIDEARTPLIISAPSASSGSSYSTFATLVKRLKPEHYEVDEKRNAASLNDAGVERVQELLGIENLYGAENVQTIYHLDQALRAQTLFTKDKNYVVTEENEVVIVDEFTGRMMPGRRYNEGLHQAIEAKEGVEVLQESATLATISFQNYFRLYKKLSGMTGTADTEEEEFQQVYDLDVIVIPTNVEINREDKADKIFATVSGKFNAIVEEVKTLQADGRAVLIGTASIEMNEVLSRLFARAGIDHSVLNAKQHESEAAIVSRAGHVGAVTLATNIAGRGTDIVLDEEVKKKGGLVVLGSERHESRRIDNQLRGRCGRQGDPGMTQFYVSAEDDLMRIFGGERLQTIMQRLGVAEDMAIENKAVSKAIENAQKKVESQNFDARKNVVQYDDVMNRHRTATYRVRHKILMSQDISELILKAIEDETKAVGSDPNMNPDAFIKEAHAVFGVDEKSLKKMADLEITKRAEELNKAVVDVYKQREKDFTKDTIRFLEREIYLQLLDTAWMNHLESMRHLRDGITWRSIGQRDPLVEYRREGQQMFKEMTAQVQTEVLRALFHAVPTPKEEIEPVETELTRAAQRSVESGANKGPAQKQSKQDKKESKTQRNALDEQSKAKNKKNELRKKRKKQRNNRKKSRR